MQIETKFNVGDTVYVCKNNSTKDLETCKICNGKGVITVKDESFCCPKCHGGKFTYTKRVKKFVPEKRIINKVIVSVTENNGNTQIYEKYDCETPSGKNRSIALYRNIMFYSMEEAEARCKELIEQEE
ncbi:MAG: hypothetical protein IJA32_01915 [Lachnospiraceae bacterium]|nr:hypothetical protein [Lachnospiraceae bacterium]